MAYAVSKAGVIHLTKCLAIALAPDIRVNSVAPGFVRTRWGERFSEEQKQRMEQNAPLRRGVAPEEIATATVECLRNDAMTRSDDRRRRGAATLDLAGCPCARTAGQRGQCIVPYTETTLTCYPASAWFEPVSSLFRDG